MCRILLLILLLASGCSGSHVFTHIGDDLRPYVQDFYSRLPNHDIASIIVMLGNIPGDGGQCIRSSGSPTVTVIINADMFKHWCDEQKRGAIFHELGHCVLNRQHTAEGSLSYMAPQMQSCQFYIDNKSALIEEMFNR